MKRELEGGDVQSSEWQRKGHTSQRNTNTRNKQCSFLNGTELIMYTNTVATNLNFLNFTKFYNSKNTPETLHKIKHTCTCISAAAQTK